MIIEIVQADYHKFYLNYHRPKGHRGTVFYPIAGFRLDK